MGEDIMALAQRFGVSDEAVRVLQEAIRRGGGRQAQFSHRELGGMGQWSAGGMTQIGDMFNTELKRTVAALCTALASTVVPEETMANEAEHNARSVWWPEDLGHPAATGAQNGMRYAYFPQARRVLVERAGVLSLYDSQDHAITGVAQQQSTTQDLVFTSQHGSIRVADLPLAG